MDATGPEVPPVLPGQGPYMRDVLHLCIVEAAGEIDGVGEISERALNTITDIVLDCEDFAVLGVACGAANAFGGLWREGGGGEISNGEWLPPGCAPKPASSPAPGTIRLVPCIADLQSVGETARGVAELQCRTRVNLGDLLLGMRGNDVAPAAKPCAAAMEAIRAAQAAEADPERSRIHKIGEQRSGWLGKHKASFVVVLRCQLPHARSKGSCPCC